MDVEKVGVGESNNSTNVDFERPIGKSVFIGDNVKVTLVEVDHHQATLLFKAPKYIQIIRSELFDETQEQPVRRKVPNEGKGRGNLIIYREKDQSVKVGESVTITICDIGFDRVRLGFDAPREIPILREELTGRSGSKERY